MGSRAKRQGVAQGAAVTVSDDRLGEVLKVWPVTAEQAVLLKTIWDTIGGPHAYWPTWDYVRRTLGRRTVDGRSEPLDAQALLDAQPIVRQPGRLGSYGLVWRSMKNQDEFVGLTIAGLTVLGRSRPVAGLYAERLVAVVRSGAGAERDLSPDPSKTLDTAFDLRGFISDMWLGEAESSNVSIQARVSLGGTSCGACAHRHGQSRSTGRAGHDRFPLNGPGAVLLGA